jgi:subtilisin family serine protease
MTNDDQTNSDDKPATGTPEREFTGDRLTRITAPPELEDGENRKRWGLGESEKDRGPYMVELNVQYVDGLGRAATAFKDLFERAVGQPGGAEPGPWELVKVSKSYFRCTMNVEEWKRLIAADEKQARKRAETAAQDARERAAKEGRAVAGSQTIDDDPYRIIYKLWPDFPIQARITRSIATIKADAALRAFEASGDAVTWAVIDSGVEASHPHFGAGGDHALNDARVANLHRCFAPIDKQTLDDPDEEIVGGPPIPEKERDRRLRLHVQHALQDPLGHGTHVAGIITGRVPDDVEPVVLEREDKIVADDAQENIPKRKRVCKERLVSTKRERDRFHGVAPGCRIVSLRVLEADGSGRSSNIVRALEYIREKLNDNPKLLRVHGVNLSVGYEFDAEMFACGQSPLCSEVNRLVQSGVVVVTAAGNTGYSTLTANGRVTKVGLSNTINDPGNAELAITVGSTHRESPHTYGVSYFSSKGPTGDGRLKPDLVAPGERIISCAAGKKKNEAFRQIEKTDPVQPTVVAASVAAPPDGQGKPDLEAPAAGAAPNAVAVAGDAAAAPAIRAFYVEDSGTSMAAPHVSGAIAAFLSIRREFIGRPLDVKRIFLESAIPLGRERYFEGHGLLDLMKAIQSV